MNMVRKLFRLARSRSGATAIEYALIAGIICLAIVGGATALGESANDTFTTVNDKVWG
jgi:pilus assembly protein Flp/PilA